ncbi:MAG TPA: response regulator [Candidatus Kaiserbacteria bacterium]|nr:response regulator [Candidatus Kaiserbacteria bacterium]
MTPNYQIFLVDDDHFLLGMYVLKFQKAGHTVESFNSGKEIISALRKKPKVDAVLLDIVMPGMDGFQILEEIRKEKLAEGAKIIVLSNQGQDSDIERAQKFNVDGYIIKASAVPSEVLEKTINIIEQKQK